MIDTPVSPTASPALRPLLPGETGERFTPPSPGPRGALAIDPNAPSLGSVLELGEQGAFKLEECLGRGGMGEVYKARQLGPNGFFQYVAIKRLRPGRKAWEERSFVDEARVLSLLRHENIARVYAFFQHQGSHYLVMEYIPGRTLHSLLELSRLKGQRFPVEVACQIAAEVAEALHHAHHVLNEAGQPLQLVHRDVSPTNIIITDEGSTKLVDFGVAYSKLEGRTKTSTASTIIKGKAPYVSPEQVKHLPVDARSDLFSLGTILVELLTGAAPFGWAADHITLKRIVEVTPEYVASMMPGVPRDLRTICQRLLAREPDLRFATGREAAQALRRHVGARGGPARIQEEVEKLKALPRAGESGAQSISEALRRTRDLRRWLTLAGAVVLVTSALISWNMDRHTSPQTPDRPAMTPPSHPEKTSSPAARPPQASGSTNNAVGACLRALALANVVTIAACQAHAPMGTSLGDCSTTPAREALGPKGPVWIPQQFSVEFVSFNRDQKCTGKSRYWGEITPGLPGIGPIDEGQREPCPYGDGPVVAKMAWRDKRTDVLGETWGPHLRDRPLLRGRAQVVPVKTTKGVDFEVLDEPGYRDHPRIGVARMLVLFTELKLLNNITEPICGVLFWHDGKEGIPILAQEHHGRSVAADWEGSFVQLYYPPWRSDLRPPFAPAAPRR